jgi:molecular chaperone GrpE
MADDTPERAESKSETASKQQAQKAAASAGSQTGTPHANAGGANAGGASGSRANGELQDAAAQIARLKTELADATENGLRIQAELENYRKRARRELDDERRYANVPLLRDLLPVLDNLQRAISAAEKTPDATGLLEGIRMVAQSLEATLSRYHCRRIEALGKAFDPAVHEAIAQQPSADYPAHTVLAVAHDGYMVHDRVVRPAQVVVSVAP